ncbi:MAG TPA: Xaa-Pro peptidase family protein [Amaricoccus sp.]|uniref:M24 family metallopeptidase n=1 Tax=Amaricoccus sp. TaxID=1872485 RepID=UPI002BAC637D|nr:Xaa-Pro peptidase family protein [Amaricoccus sp.]HMQ93568.1 Xaa-Pro peptidase family protein [Amaricoccus sp.]HMR53179.1 Xaa-Pro peptidase family protein [Amaricoccus sp.]HMR61426.1 Xaa-Pro peptidase family protein [Amaricoccus sp.]HMU00075.1 Xaa-Pro peptidase family protein [Amaricoccus sp.]
MPDRDPRLTPLRAVMASGSLDAVALVPGANFRRLLGRDFHQNERPLVLVVPAEGPPAAVVPNLEMASFSTLDFRGAIFDWRDENGFEHAFRALGGALGGLGAAGARIGVEAQRMRVFEATALQAAFPAAQLVDAHAAISSIRLRKAPEEVALLRQAIRISEAALEATLTQVRAGMTETEVAGVLMRELFDHGADGLAFEPIVAAGDNSAQPHARPRFDYRIRPGDALLFDFGASYQGYNADITRTFFVADASEKDRAFYDTVLAANEAGRAASRAGRSAHDVDDAVQRLLEASPFAAFARHKTGHGLGLDVHEAPQIMRGNAAVLESGMVFTVEPGLYRLGECGVRIEDDVLVTETGIDCLTTFPRELRILGGP